MLLLVYYNGQIYDGSQGVMYNGPRPIGLNLKNRCGLQQLQFYVHRKLGLPENSVVDKIIYRVPISVNPLFYNVFELSSDEDVESMFENHSQLQSLGAIEIYVEAKIIEDEVGGDDDDEDGDEEDGDEQDDDEQNGDEQDDDAQGVDASVACSIPTSYPPYSQEGIEAELCYQPEIGSYGFQHGLASSSQARIPEPVHVNECNNPLLGSNVRTRLVEEYEVGGSERRNEQSNINRGNSPIDSLLDTSDDEEAEYVPSEEELGDDEEYQQVLDLNVPPLGEKLHQVTLIQTVIPPHYLYVNFKTLQQTDVFEGVVGHNR